MPFVVFRGNPYAPVGSRENPAVATVLTRTAVATTMSLASPIFGQYTDVTAHEFYITIDSVLSMTNATAVGLQDATTGAAVPMYDRIGNLVLENQLVRYGSDRCVLKCLYVTDPMNTTTPAHIVVCSNIIPRSCLTSAGIDSAIIPVEPPEEPETP